MAPEIGTVSAERIGAEIRRMLIDPNRATALALLRETNLLVQVLPEIASLTPKPQFNETSTGSRHVSDQPSISVALAALLLPTPHSPLPTAPSSLPPSIGRRLRYTNKEVDRTVWLLASQPLIAQAPTTRLAQITTTAHPRRRSANFSHCHEAIAGPDDPALAFCRERLDLACRAAKPTAAGRRFQH